MENKIGPFTINGKPAFTQITEAEAAPYVILVVKDPLHGCEEDTSDTIASFFEEKKLIADTGMCRTFTGKYKGTPISVTSTGSGSPEVELALMDYMMNTKAHTFIRVGGSGAMQEHLHVGDLIIATGAVRDEGTSKEYVDIAYPAVASYEVVLALTQAAANAGYPFHLGITRSCDSEYAGVSRPSRNGYLQDCHRAKLKYWHQAGVLNADRETSIILTLCSMFGLRGGAINSIGDNFISGEEFVAGAGFEHAIRTCLEAFALLHEWDQAKTDQRANYWVPSLKSSK